MSQPTNQGPPASEISRLTEHLFRHEAAKLISVLTRIFGLERLDLAEDVVQEALVRALQTWPYYGIPKNPAAWITQTAKNLALDLTRREKWFRDRQDQIAASIEQWSTEPVAGDTVLLDSEIKDGRLRLMFACCHSLIPPEAQAALALKTLCGFGVTEIAAAFLTSEAAIAKRLTRARQKIREAGIPFEIPTGNELEERLEGVLQTLYLLFNEGYKASSGKDLVRHDLCAEAIRLVISLTDHPVGNQPRTHALAALMLFNGARLPSRSDPHGQILQLRDQDRSSWDKSMIHRALGHLAHSAAGDEMSDYHLQAAIAACHCIAKNYESTDWKQILFYYDKWVEYDTSAIVGLNRAVAVAQVHGPAAALDALATMPNRQQVEGYYLFYAVRADLEAQLRNYTEASAQLRRAIALTDLQLERNFLNEKLQHYEANSS